MAISLQKGQKIDLTKGNPGLNNIIVGLGWDVNKYDGQADFDLDASAFSLQKPVLYPFFDTIVGRETLHSVLSLE